MSESSRHWVFWLGRERVLDMRSVRFVACLLGSGMFAVLAASCGSSGKNGGNGGAGGSIIGFGGNGAGNSSNLGPACQTNADCTAGKVCHPISKTCETPGGSCTSNSNCAAGTYCDTASSTCLPGVTGSPCDTSAQCVDQNTCTTGICGCGGIASEQELIGGALDIYFVFDRTASMGTDCAYVPGGTPPVQSKACYATYALPDYLINVPQAVDTRFAFQFMSLGQAPGDCNGTAYATPAYPLTQLPLQATDPIVQAISNETFAGGFGTHIEGALRGIAQFTAGHVTQGREMIGVLMTDGDPNGCQQDIPTLATIISDHLVATKIRTFIIGMQGATDANLEQLAVAGGADPHNDFCGSVTPPCHYWNVGDGSGDAITSALQAIVKQSAPLPCTYDVVDLKPPAGQTLDYGKVNVTLTNPTGTTTIGQVPAASSCPSGTPAWYYDNPTAPTTIDLCPSTCSIVSSAAQGSRLSVVLGCTPTVTIPLR